MMNAKNYVRNVKEIVGMLKAIKRVANSEEPEMIASATEFVLEGLHVNKKLNKTRSEGKIIYRN